MGSDFIAYGFDNYISSFKTYYKNYPLNFNKKLFNLRSSLDIKSLSHLDFFINLMIDLPLPSRDFLVKSTRILNNDFLSDVVQENMFLKSIHTYYDKYNLNGTEKLEINVFKYHCGLKFIPSDVLNMVYNKAIIDVGAFWGDSPLVLSKYTNSKLYCFEPNSVNFSLLYKTVHNNYLDDRCLLFNMGAYYKNTKKTMNYISNNQNHGASLVFKPHRPKQELVSLVSLDGVIDSHEDVGIIKIDAEGVGLEVIRGAKRLISKCKPVISCAIYHNPMELLHIKSLLAKLNPQYKFKIVTLNHNFVLKELTLLAY